MAERTLTKHEIERLALFSCKYPWSPWDMLMLIKRIQELEYKPPAPCGPDSL